MGQFPKPFPETIGPALASYNYSDIAEGSGVQIYYGTKAHTDSNFANDKFILSEAPIIASGNAAGGTNGVIACSALPVDFEIVFNTPKTIKGNLYATIPLHVDTGQTANAQITIQKWDGTSETDIVAQISSPTYGNVGSDVYVDVTIKVVVPKTSFKAGETLRIQLDSSSNSSGDDIGINPAGSEVLFTKSGGAMRFYVPFLLNI